MFIIQLDDCVFYLILGRRTNTRKSQKADTAIIICARNQLIMTVVIGSFNQKIRVFFICLDGEISLADVPKFDYLVMAAQQTVLLIGIIVDICDALPRPNSVFLSALNQ